MGWVCVVNIPILLLIALYVRWVCFAWLYFLFESFSFSSLKFLSASCWHLFAPLLGHIQARTHHTPQSRHEHGHVQCACAPTARSVWPVWPTCVAADASPARPQVGIGPGVSTRARSSVLGAFVAGLGALWFSYGVVRCFTVFYGVLRYFTVFYGVVRCFTVFGPCVGPCVVRCSYGVESVRDVRCTPL